MNRKAVVLVAALFLIPAYSNGPKSYACQQQQSVVYVCPMHPDVKSSKPGKCPKCGMTLVAQTSDSTASGGARPGAPAGQNPAAGATVSPSAQAQQATPASTSDQNAEAWTCPMHLYLRLDKPGKCPICGTPLVPANPSILGVYNVNLRVTPDVVKTGQKVKLTFDFYEPDNGKRVTMFSPTHTKLFHLFVVSRDMTSFQHIHPVFEKDGTFTIDTVLPNPGVYKIYADVYPSAGTPQVLQASVVTAGYHPDLFSSIPNLVPDKVLSKVVDGMKVDVKFDPVEMLAGQPLYINFHLTDAKTGEPVHDLHPYLGAWGHMLMLSADGVDYVHSHPSKMVPENVDPDTLHGGPDVVFQAMLPEPGMYRMWTQFRRGPKLITVSFNLRANDLQ